MANLLRELQRKRVAREAMLESLSSKVWEKTFSGSISTNFPVRARKILTRFSVAEPSDRERRTSGEAGLSGLGLNSTILINVACSATIHFRAAPLYRKREIFQSRGKFPR